MLGYLVGILHFPCPESLDFLFLPCFKEWLCCLPNCPSLTYRSYLDVSLYSYWNNPSRKICITFRIQQVQLPLMHSSSTRSLSHYSLLAGLFYLLAPVLTSLRVCSSLWWLDSKYKSVNSYCSILQNYGASIPHLPSPNCLYQIRGFLLLLCKAVRDLASRWSASAFPSVYVSLHCSTGLVVCSAPCHACCCL